MSTATRYNLHLKHQTVHTLNMFMLYGKGNMIYDKFMMIKCVSLLQA